jgi:MoxR-like ATPase
MTARQRTAAWLEAIRALAAAHVGSTRQRWQDLGRPVTVHDGIDAVLTGPSCPDDSVVTAAQDARQALAADPHWRRLVEAFDVDQRGVEWLALLAACELVPPLTRVLGYLDDSASPAPPTPAAAGVLWGWPLGYQPGPASALTSWRLAGPDGGQWHRTNTWRIDPEIASFVAAEAGWVRLRASVGPVEVDGLDCLHPELLEQMRTAVAAIVAARTVGCEVELIGEPGSGRRTLLAQLATTLERTPLLMTGDDPVRSLRDVRLLDAVPIWVDDGELPVGTDASPGALTLVARRTATSSTPDDVVRLSWPLPAIGRPQRERLWAARTGHPAPQIVRDWQLRPADVRVAAAAAAAGREVASEAIRRRLRAGALETMTPLERPYEWDDLVIPDRVRDELRRLHNQVLLAGDVLEDWEFRRLFPTATGTTALFTGPSGTGKTMAAQVLARSLGLDLYRVDLAEVVNKYIGETEKRLAAVFAECERSNVMVLFDEADALFGQRTRVRDAHDRYANIEIDYLLQRLDTFRGVAVLATNRKSDLDPAFLRRLRVIIDFVAPAPAERLRLWAHALPETTSTGEPLTADLDREWLAANLELTGAEITLIALAAAFDAREAGELIETAHVVAASRRELDKRGTVLRLEAPLSARRVGEVPA